MTQDYHITMDGGKRFLTIRADSAATAMQTALERNRGFRVVECYAGDGYDPRFPQYRARLDFEVPPHEALPIVDKVKPTRPACEMFDDAEIVAESARAKEKRGA